MVRERNEELAPFRILTGIEVDILEDGALDQSEELLARLDVVVASVHSKLRMERPEMTRRMVRAVASPHVDILGHCTGRKLVGQGRPPSAFDAEIVFAACAQFDTALEINCRPSARTRPTSCWRWRWTGTCAWRWTPTPAPPARWSGRSTAATRPPATASNRSRIVNTMAADDPRGLGGEPRVSRSGVPHPQCAP